MEIVPTDFAGLYVIKYSPVGDSRGQFYRTYCQDTFQAKNLCVNYPQMNHSITSGRGSFRGLHYQTSPYSEVKIVRCVSGKVIDFAVDLRQKSETFLQTFSIDLEAQASPNAVYIPEGFAHGFQVLSDRAELVYMHSKPYAPSHYGVLSYKDPKIRLTLPLPVSEISDKDANADHLPADFSGLSLG